MCNKRVYDLTYFVLLLLPIALISFFCVAISSANSSSNTALNFTRINGTKTMQTSLEHENDNLAAELLIVRPDEIIPLLVANISKTDESNNRVENFLREITSISTQQLDFALEGVNDGWELFVSDGELKMYKMERELEGGIVVDPLKAGSSIKYK